MSTSRIVKSFPSALIISLARIVPGSRGPLKSLAALRIAIPFVKGSSAFKMTVPRRNGLAARPSPPRFFRAIHKLDMRDTYVRNDATSGAAISQEPQSHLVVHSDFPNSEFILGRLRESFGQADMIIEVPLCFSSLRKRRARPLRRKSFVWFAVTSSNLRPHPA